MAAAPTFEQVGEMVGHRQHGGAVAGDRCQAIDIVLLRCCDYLSHETVRKKDDDGAA